MGLITTKFVTVLKKGKGFEMNIFNSTPPEGKGWEVIGNFTRFSDNIHFTVFGKDIYAGEVNAAKLEHQLAEFLKMGKRLA